jgi:hypothetical protein
MMNRNLILGLFIVIVLLIVGWLFLFEEEERVLIIEEMCTTCGNDCVTLEFATRADCFLTTEEFGCKYEGRECYRVEIDNNAVIVENNVCGDGVCEKGEANKLECDDATCSGSGGCETPCNEQLGTGTCPRDCEGSDNVLDNDFFDCGDGTICSG